MRLIDIGRIAGKAFPYDKFINLMINYEISFYIRISEANWWPDHKKDLYQVWREGWREKRVLKGQMTGLSTANPAIMMLEGVSDESQKAKCQ